MRTQAVLLLALALCARANEADENSGTPAPDHRINMVLESDGEHSAFKVPNKLKLDMTPEAWKSVQMEPRAFTLAKVTNYQNSASFGTCSACAGDGKTVWIQAFGRSGSSTTQELVMQAMDQDKLFSIFEPCGNKDVYKHQTMSKGNNMNPKCMNYMDDVQNCDFDDIDDIVHWKNKDSISNAPNYGKMTAAVECQHAQLRVYKTLNARKLSTALPVLDRHNDTRMVQIIRDPRAIWASQKLAVEAGVFTGAWHPAAMCALMKQNMQVKHPSLMHFQFEDLIKSPQRVARFLYAHLNLEFGDKQTEWIEKNFGLHEECHETHLSTCKKDSSASLEKWKLQMDQEAAQEFSSPNCVSVLEHYGYDPVTTVHPNFLKTKRNPLKKGKGRK